MLETSELLAIRGLKTYFYQEGKALRAVDGVSLNIKKGEILGVVGESGCGKTVTALSIMGLIGGKGKIVDGEILFCGRDLRKLDAEAMRQICGKEISMIFQDPMISLNPVYTVGQQIIEALRAHMHISKKDAMEIALKMIDKMGIPSPERRVRDYPHQLSGGMRQRVMIAMALCMNPKLLIADEPTTALDVTIQAQILDLILDLRDQFGMAVMIITHDLGVIADLSDRVVVMYAGKVVETAYVRTLFANPCHPYTRGLMKALPRLDDDLKTLYTISGVVPSPENFPKGCRFADRCPISDESCRAAEPPLITLEKGHEAACHRLDEARKAI